MGKEMPGVVHRLHPDRLRRTWRRGKRLIRGGLLAGGRCSGEWYGEILDEDGQPVLQDW